MRPNEPVTVGDDLLAYIAIQRFATAVHNVGEERLVEPWLVGLHVVRSRSLVPIQYENDQILALLERDDGTSCRRRGSC